MLFENISKSKVIGIGGETILPGESRTIPKEYENSPVLKIYERKGFARMSGSVLSPIPEKTVEEQKAEKDAADTLAAENAEALRKARLASLKGIGEEALGRLAEELGIHPPDCKDSADMLKKVKNALKG